MTRDEAKKLLPVIQAYADGKDVQVKQLDGSWYDTSNPGFGVGAENYRIKPEPLECWVVMQSDGGICCYYNKATAENHVCLGSYGPYTITTCAR